LTTISIALDFILQVCKS